MRTTITTEHGTYTGRSVETIIRREYGRKAEFKGSADRNSPHAGLVVRWDERAGGFHVLATVRSIETADRAGAVVPAGRVWTMAEVAAYLDVVEGTVRGYLARGQMPEPDGRLGRTPWWYPETIRSWRPGTAR